MRNKNAKRKHFIADRTKTVDTVDKVSEWLALGKDITSMENDMDEKTESYSDYAGDGTEHDEIIGVTPKWKGSGKLNRDDKAQALIEAKEYAIGEERKIFHKYVDSDGKTERAGLATLTDIKIAGGDASEYEEVEFTISHDEVPKKKTVTPAVSPVPGG